MNNVRLLDCTLRDGGHINNCNFGEKVIKSIVNDLVRAKVDVIEVGFLSNTKSGPDYAKYQSISEVKSILPSQMGNTKVALMADNVDLSDLEIYDGTVEYIRLSFRIGEIDWAKTAARTVINKGYKCIINPIHGSAISDKEYISIIDWVNELHPFGFTIVDTFGAMRHSDLARIYLITEHNLDQDIQIGVHLHENMGLSFSMAQHLLGILSPKRDIMIDGTLYGIGKVPGNLCIEQMMDYLNYSYKKSYAIEPVYDSIDEHIMPIREHIAWGYSIPYAISGQCSVHRSYAEFLQRKERLRSKDMRRIMSAIDETHSDIFDEKYAEDLYNSYLSIEYEDNKDLEKLKKQIKKYKNILVVAPGKSIKNYNFETKKLNDSCVICVNFFDKSFKHDLLFFTNAKRIRHLDKEDYSELIITSNLLDDYGSAEYIVSRNDLVYHDDVFCDDSTIMLLNLLRKLNVTSVSICGFDGFHRGKNNFFDESYERDVRDDDYEIQSRINILKNSYSCIDIKYLTPSIYDV